MDLQNMEQTKPLKAMDNNNHTLQSFLPTVQLQIHPTSLLKVLLACTPREFPTLEEMS